LSSPLLAFKENCPVSKYREAACCLNAATGAILAAIGGGKRMAGDWPTIVVRALFLFTVLVAVVEFYGGKVTRSV